jgi:uncharacterized protein
VPQSKLLKNVDALGKHVEYVIATMMIGCVQLYRWTLSPIFGRFCRFDPTCSGYTLEALKRHGPWKGTMLGAKRIGRCHPLGGFGFDPVPPHDKNTHHPNTK